MLVAKMQQFCSAGTFQTILWNTEETQTSYLRPPPLHNWPIEATDLLSLLNRTFGGGVYFVDFIINITVTINFTIIITIIITINITINMTITINININIILNININIKLISWHGCTVLENRG
jgi:hypothetical protein